MNITWMLAIFVSEFPINPFILGGSINSKSYDVEFARVDNKKRPNVHFYPPWKLPRNARGDVPGRTGYLVMFKLKMHLAPMFSRWSKSSCYSKNLSDLIESSISFAASKLCLKCCATAFFRVWGGGCWWRLPEPNIMAPQSSLCIFFEKMEDNIFLD